MGIEEFDPISQPKRIKGAEELEKLPESQKIVLIAEPTKKEKEIEETVKE